MGGAIENHAKLDISRVIRRTLEVLRRNWRSLVRPALLFLYLPGIVLGLLGRPAGPIFTHAHASAALPLASLLAFIPYAWFQGGLFRLTVADLHAEPISTDDALRVGRDRLWALYGLSLLAGIGVALGLILVIIPGVLLALAWSVSGPVLIEERRPILECFPRSADLTRHTRLNIFGLGLAFAVAQILGSAVVAVVSAPFPPLAASALLWPLYSAATGVVGGVLLAVIYDELRARKTEREAPAEP